MQQLYLNSLLSSAESADILSVYKHCALHYGKKNKAITWHL